MKLISGLVLLLITAEDKRKVLESDIAVGDTTVSIHKAVEAEYGVSDLYDQAVNSAKVIAVADDVKHIQPGDIAIVDYFVDSLPELVVYKDDKVKLLCVDSRTIYHEDEMISRASMNAHTERIVWSKGDIDTASLIFGVFRDGLLMPNPPYVFCEHKDFNITTKTETGIDYNHLEYGSLIRRVLVPNKDTDEAVQPGSLVVVSDHTLYERVLDGKNFDVIMNDDIEIIFE